MKLKNYTRWLDQNYLKNASIGIMIVLDWTIFVYGASMHVARSQ